MTLHDPLFMALVTTAAVTHAHATDVTYTPAKCYNEFQSNHLTAMPNRRREASYSGPRAI